MADEADIRILVKILCAKEKTELEEIERNPSTPPCLLTDEFLNGMFYLSDLRQKFLVRKWSRYIDTYYKEMFESHEMYLSYLMFAFIKELEYHQNIFDSFLSVYKLVKYLNEKTYIKTGLEFSGLNYDIIMIIYQNEMKRTFSKKGGFNGLVEYMCAHAQPEQNYNKKNFIFGDYDYPHKGNRKFKEEYRDALWKSENPDNVLIDERMIKLAKNVLSTSSVELPTLPSYEDLIIRMVALETKNVKANFGRKLGDVDVESLGDSKSISKSKPTQDWESQENVEQYENSIQAVMRYNRLKNFGKQGSKNPQQEKADEVLKHLKDTIQSLSKVLDDYNKE